MDKAMNFIKLVKEELEPTLYGEFREIIINEFLKPEQDPAAILAAVEKMKRLLEGHNRLLGEFDVFLGKKSNSSGDGQGDVSEGYDGLNGEIINDKKHFDGSLDLGNNSELYESIERPTKKSKTKKTANQDKAKPSKTPYISQFDGGQSSSSMIYAKHNFMKSSSSMEDPAPSEDLNDSAEGDSSMEVLENYTSNGIDQQHLTRTYISEVKSRLQQTPATMAYFMEILRQYTMEQNADGVNIAFDRISKLFVPDYMDLLYSLENFFPEPSKSIVIKRIAQHKEKEAIDKERADVTRQIIELLQPGPNMANFEDKVAMMGKRLEEILYNKATNMEEYRDITSLRARLREHAHLVGVKLQ